MDSIIRKGYSKAITNFIISKEEINNNIYDGSSQIKKKPQWRRFERNIRRKYDQGRAHSLIVEAKFAWYEKKENWPLSIKYGIEMIENRGINANGIESLAINSFIFNFIFKRSKNKSQLEKGKKWMEILLKNKSDKYTWIDTYANILYKLGDKENAIKIEERAINIIKESKPSLFRDDDLKLFTETLIKMKDGLPTW
jgi:tetratricopeptide (TPR) repeat protein